MQSAESGRVVRARTIDLSLGGVGLVTTGTLVIGEYVTIVFPFPVPPAKRSTEVLGRVVSLLADDDANRVGVEFFEPLSVSRAPNLARRLQEI